MAVKRRAKGSQKTRQIKGYSRKTGYKKRGRSRAQTDKMRRRKKQRKQMLILGSDQRLSKEDRSLFRSSAKKVSTKWGDWGKWGG